MPKALRVLLGLFTLFLPLALAGCPGDFSGGFDKVPMRERTPVALAAAPDPPPVTAGVGVPVAVELPDLPPGAPAGVTLAMVEEGQQLYGTICGACHGPAGVGTAAGPALNDQDWIHIDGSFDQVAAIIQSGVPAPARFPGMMPPLGGGNFTPDQVRSLAAYIFALSH